MAILKHIASKSKIYSGAEQYLCFEHDAKTAKPMLDEQGRMILRKGILKAAINCEFETFAAECMEINHKYHKNSGRADIKSHDYIISFDPKDALSSSDVMELAKKFAKQFLEGHQTIIVVHPDGHNGSGNMHAHIVANSVRKYESKKQKWHKKACEYRRGCKHKCTNAMLKSGKQWIMNECMSIGLNQVDLFSAKVREDYWIKKRGLEKNSEFLSDKQRIRGYIDTALDHTSSLDQLVEVLDNLYGVTTRITDKTISFKLYNSKKAIRGVRLGDNYTKEAIIGRQQEYINEKAKRGALIKIENNRLVDKIVRDIQKKKNSFTASEDNCMVAKKDLKHYDSYITDNYVQTAIAVESDAETELETIEKPGSWREEISKFTKAHPGMDIDEAMESFDKYYEELCNKYQSQCEKIVSREIKTKSR